MTLALTWGVWRSVKETVPHDNYCWLGGIAASYILWMVLANLGGRLPRTDEPKFIDYAKRWHSVDSKSEHFVKTTTSNLRVWISEWRLLAVPVVLLGISLWLGFDSDDPAGSLAASAGVAITLLSAWSWWRISFTYRSYLYDLARYSKQP